MVPGNENRWLRIYAVFGFNAESSLEDKMEFVNRVNAELVIVRAYVDNTGRFIFEHYLPRYAGNLDIMTSAALKTAEKIAARMHEGAVA